MIVKAFPLIDRMRPMHRDYDQRRDRVDADGMTGPTMSDFDQVEEAAQYLRTRLGSPPEVAVVLGTGLGAFAANLADAIVLPYGDVPHWPASGVVGHAGRLVAGRTSGGQRVLALSGRVHLYEGHSTAKATFGIRVLGRLGVRTLILTNAAGGINTHFAAGALMVIDDHINFMGVNPLIGPNEERWGRRFPDMSEVYAKPLRLVAGEAARAAGLQVEHGVYIAVSGPSYETPAEIRAFRSLGADAVGMSTVPEVVVARHAGMRVLGISTITNLALPDPPADYTLSHEEVLQTGRQVIPRLIQLIHGVVRRL